ncbi:EXS-domain-containing protein [Basidiobolus meristosporus CBS 931.73]|uniref:EXS-domain-containing protein n=1 Tax=Basidiobolus meristosporus CBS 931.73 TaxID=1314790 RepID=A0A1Y1Y5A3_9FUNG|nr:EXS-domain-containing protein [Basidiobolus meristosporus CBS 931.73]|eukprot:ORX93187.1 EXS-domain-containing protein [Basidiobolus meristosporus CBS 931.73]
MVVSLFPVEYRVLLLIDLGIWCWSLNLQLLNKAGIDVQILFELEKNDHKAHRVFYNIALVFTLITQFFLMFFWLLVNFNYSGIVATAMCYFVLLFLTICPFNILHKKTRFIFLSSLIRIVFSPLRSEPTFEDVILADILTSFAKVITGLLFALGMFFTSLKHEPATPEDMHRAFELSFIGPIITSLPFLFRLRQCVSEYLTTKGTGYKPLANAVKYASAFPVIFLSAAMHNQSEANGNLFIIWLLAVIFNSLYSFYWDVVMDWGLGARFSAEKGTRMMLLRQILIYRKPVYYISILIDFFLRTTWSLKLSESLKSEDLLAGGFILEVAEILRRWLWIYFRVEKEWISTELDRTRTNYSLQLLDSSDSEDELEELNLIMNEL